MPVPFPAAPIYSAAKAGLHAYTRCLRAQLEGSGVTVVELAPPGTETPSVAKPEIISPMEAFLPPTSSTSLFFNRSNGMM